MSWSTNRPATFYAARNDIIDAVVRIEVDWDKLARMLGKKAFANKSGKSKLNCGIKASIVNSTKR